MITFPNAKINLGLNILEKRPDGFHNIASVFYPLAWSDVLEIIPAESFSFTSSGLAIPGNQESNLVIKAFKLLQNQGIIVGKNAAIHLHKIIPMGAGLGGGSADGAFALKLLNDIFNCGLSHTQMQKMAAILGSDCPFFIENKPMFCHGRGELFETIDLNLSGKFIVLVNPQIHISTAEAFAGILPKKPQMPIQEIIKLPIKKWKNILVNDFEGGLQSKYPKLIEIKLKLYDLGAEYASMTGSGSTVYGIFDKEVVGFEKVFLDCVCWAGEM